MFAYYNEIDPYAAQWLRNLVVAGHIAPGDVDERSIIDVRPGDLAGYTQCHFFAGIGGWSVALRLAGWSDDRAVWTGSCPCQPFSSAGKRGGGADERHLWPHWRRLIGECRPATIFGEQVAQAIGWGWLDAVCADLEAHGYATGAAVLPACSVGAPHIRQRLWFVADADATRWTHVARFAAAEAQSDIWQAAGVGGGAPADTYRQSEHAGAVNAEVAAASELELAPHTDREPSRRPAISRGERNFWPVEPEVGRVAHGIPRAMEQLRAYGNAIVPQTAAAFIEAFNTARFAYGD